MNPRLLEIEARKVAIRALLEGTETVDLDALEKELRDLDVEKAQIEKRNQLATGINAGGDARIIKDVNIIARKHDPEPEDKPEFREIGEFLQTVKWNPQDPALRAKEFGKDAEKRFMQMGIGANGGFIVPEQFSNEIKMVDDQAAIFRPRAQVIPAGDPPDAAITIPALDQSGANGVYAGVTVTWIAEGATKPETEPNFREIKLEPQEVAAHIIVTDKLLRNSAAAGALVSNLLRKAIIGAEEDTFLSGNGVGQPLGIINHPAAITIPRAVANQIAYADVVNMFARAKFGGKLCWIGSQTILPQLMRMVDTGNNLVWQPNAREGAPGTLLGIPFLLNDQSPSLGTEGDLMLIDLNYYLIKDGSGISIAMSEHPLFTQNRTIIKAFWNVDGQPWLITPLIQRNGVDTVSPFVVLD
ncbi:MAG: phage major capsid protein [Syntrophomonadaceae bacterium]|nr:phage major capsid protein [Syntrophomonadaceae bacterium]